MKGPIAVLLLMALVSTVLGVDGDGVLTGYLMTSADHCLDTAGTASTDPTGTTEADLSAACKLVYLVETATTDQYYILDAAAQTDSLQLVDSVAPSFAANTLAVQFSDGDALLTTPTAASTADITNNAAPFLIQLAGATAADEACLTLTPQYLATGCGDAKWYFIEAECQVADCMTCNVDAFKCDSCTDTTHVFNGDKSACQDCDTAFTDCTTCSDTTGTAECSACGNNMYLAANSLSCVECSVRIAECNTCDDSSGTTLCTACDNSKYPAADGLTCQDCGTVITDCTACSVSDGTTTCDTCSSLTVSFDTTACISCSVASCTSCSSADVCATCDGDLVPNSAGDTCEACTDAITNCNTCDDSTGEAVCSACDATDYPTLDGSACDTCSNVITECATCDASSGSTLCTACDGGKYPETDGLSCDVCGTVITDCTSCNVVDGMTTCETCTGKDVSSNATLCVTCDVTDCETCSEDDICATCTGSLVPSDTGDACQEAESTTAGSDTVLHKVPYITLTTLAGLLVFATI